MCMYMFCLPPCTHCTHLCCVCANTHRLFSDKTLNERFCNTGLSLCATRVSLTSVYTSMLHVSHIVQRHVLKTVVSIERIWQDFGLFERSRESGRILGGLFERSRESGRILGGCLKEVEKVAGFWGLFERSRESGRILGAV